MATTSILHVLRILYIDYVSMNEAGVKNVYTLAVKKTTSSDVTNTQTTQTKGQSIAHPVHIAVVTEDWYTPCGTGRSPEAGD